MPYIFFMLAVCENVHSAFHKIIEQGDAGDAAWRLNPFINMLGIIVKKIQAGCIWCFLKEPI